MTSREIVARTLSFSRPERVARSFGDSDIAGAGHTVPTPATDWRVVDGQRWERTDEWGNTWARIDPTSKGEIAKGALASLDEVDTFPLPDFSNPVHYANVRTAREQWPDKYLLGGLPGFTFNIARKLRRLDTYLTDLLVSPEPLRRLHDRIDQCIEDMIRNYAKAGVDAVMFPEDWGAQQGLLIDPALWRTEFEPRFHHLCGVARDAGIRVWMHSCGQIGAIIPHLMEAGISVLQFDQPRLHGIDALARRQEAGPITFWCPVDIQQTLPTREPAQIEAEAQELIAKLWKGQGGFIAGFYPDEASIGLTPEWQQIACEAFNKAGRPTANTGG